MGRIARRLAALSFEALIALFAILSGLAQLFGTGAEGAVSQAAAGPWDEIWAASYALSGIIVLVGIGAGSWAIEGAGVTWLAGGICINLIAIVALEGFAVLPLLPTFVASLLACLARVWMLAKGTDVIAVKTGPVDDDG